MMQYSVISLIATQTVASQVLQLAAANPLDLHSWDSRARAYGLPYYSRDASIVDRDGKHVQLHGVNWAGHQEAMIPEGLQYNSIENITSMVHSLGFNVVRVTFATEMIDDLYDNDMKDITISESLTRALGTTNGTRVLNQILQHNPQFTNETTRLEVFDALAWEFGRKKLIYYLDNHMSTAKWCCDPKDGNAWLGDSEFDPFKWKRGLVYMAQRARRWPTIGIIGLRNEFRQPDPKSRGLPWNWFLWQQYMVDTAEAVHRANSVPLLSMMGLPWVNTLLDDTALTGPNVTDGQSYTAFFRPGQYDWSNKVILENHKYDTNPTSNANCTRFIEEYMVRGFRALDPDDQSVKFRWPVVLGEWGYPQNGEYYKLEYPQCLIQFFQKYKPNWMYWALSGSYYSFTKHGQATIQDYDEHYGLLNHNWTGWRSQETIDQYFKPAIEASKWSTQWP